MSRFSKKIKEAVNERAFGCCEYCQVFANFSPSPFSIEHITPKSKGGKHDLSNLAQACNGCNWFKATKVEGIDIESNTLVPLFHPRQHVWSEHFTWSDDFLKVIGLTPTGRATIISLKLNRVELINLRFALVAIGVHPPKHSIE